MKIEKLVGERFKERPSDCSIDSHALMVRGGYMKYVANGIYSQYTPLRRVCRKIEGIIREEMEAIDGQEVQFPVALPASLWEESGRYDSVGSELLRFEDRNESRMVLGMTHEEAAVQLVREYGKSYAKYPFMIYQIQTKFRDEARPRAGLIRVREFTMKDAYSFHTSQEDMEEYYEKCFRAYERIFERAGIPETIAVASDSGMMGGSLSHEFMLLTPAGEDSIAVCEECGYKSNVESAASIIRNESEPFKELSLVYTPDIHTIEEVCEFLKSSREKSCKAVVYQKCSDGRLVVLFIRGDLEVNETKVRNWLGDEIRPADITEDSGLHPGYIGPYHLDGDFTVLYDDSLRGGCNLSCGGNTEEHHYTGLCMERDCPDAVYHDFAKIKENGICPECKKHSIKISRGIEVGNIFQLGKKYTESMEMKYLDKEGKEHYPVMGCYGIGIGRLAASVCEAHHDEYGPVWPAAIAPWQVHLCCVRPDNREVKEYADRLYEEMTNAGIEVIYDDRSISAGVMFSEADLLGVPVRVIVSPRNMKEGCCEIVTRDKRIQKKAALDEVMAVTEALVAGNHAF
ncbi:proline--tRNA ligase [Murimonas intestini]|uniref:Proline--tRNA ligase n=1 Tax=Murimonas intestini TaxID=1337051 RepID=A0AB73T183_9FIRM|nr:proline--tRNA ligase [Murimonas intestini]MCR1842419.1 proline--tRNA ligase [Murimonas intestini]MCR1867223.1 proline--tRNA ligase [Murimonas intestini]MCR1884409.1 proline--tRNA ligase [Murimonas intestini]